MKNPLAEFDGAVSPFFLRIQSNAGGFRTPTVLRDMLLPKL